MGFHEPHPKLKYFVTVGAPDFLGGLAEHLKATPKRFEEQRTRAGRVIRHGGECARGLSLCWSGRSNREPLAASRADDHGHSHCPFAQHIQKTVL